MKIPTHILRPDIGRIAIVNIKKCYWQDERIRITLRFIPSRSLFRVKKDHAQTNHEKFIEHCE